MITVAAPLTETNVICPDTVANMAATLDEAVLQEAVTNWAAETVVELVVTYDPLTVYGPMPALSPETGFHHTLSRDGSRAVLSYCGDNGLQRQFPHYPRY